MISKNNQKPIIVINILFRKLFYVHFWQLNGMKKQLKCTSVISELDRFIRVSISGRRRKPDGHRLTAGTIETYKNFRKIFCAFSDKTIEPVIFTGFRVTKPIFRERSHYWKRVLQNFTDYLRSCHYSDNYIWNNLKIFRALLRYLGEQFGWPDTNFAVFKLPRLSQPIPITLSLEQIQELIKEKFEENLKGRKLAEVRDKIVMGSIAALRYSDLISLQWQNIVEMRGKSWLEYQSKKTGTQTRLLLPNCLIESMRKNRKRGIRTLFPRISNVNLNKQIKRLGRYMNWDDTTPVYKTNNGQLKLDRMGKFHELLTTHTMRRTGISLMLQLGMPENVVWRISGHAPNSKEFYRYLKIAQSWQDEECEKVHKLLY